MERLAELRESQALTLRDLAERSGVDANTINQVELGHRKPRPSTLRKLAKALDVEIREFFEEPVPLGEAPVEGRPSITVEQALETASIDPYTWIQAQTTDELQQIALEAAQFTKTGTRKDLIRNKGNKELHLEAPRRRVLARTLIRNIIGELELRDAPFSQVKLVLKQVDDIMNPPEETIGQGHEERQGKVIG